MHKNLRRDILGVGRFGQLGPEITIDSLYVSLVQLSEGVAVSPLGGEHQRFFLVVLI